MNTTTTPAVKKVSGQNAATIRQIWDHVKDNEEDLVTEFGLDPKEFKKFVAKQHGKCFSSFRKKNMSANSMTRKMLDKYFGIDDGVSLDDLLAEMDD